MAEYYTAEQMNAIAAEIGQRIAQSRPLPAPDFQDLSGSEVWYFGWTSVQGGWLVQEHRRSDARTRSARDGYAAIDAAWAARASLQYS